MQHNFDVIRVAGNSSYNFVNPVRRDTVSIGGGGDNVTFRFVTDNPGPWFLHCHIDWHLQAYAPDCNEYETCAYPTSSGLAIVFAEDAEDILANDPPNSRYIYPLILCKY